MLRYEAHRLSVMRFLSSAHPTYYLNLMAATLQRGNAEEDAPASRNAGAFKYAFPRRPWEREEMYIIVALVTTLLFLLHPRLLIR